jgi:hypothetical protein
VVADYSKRREPRWRRTTRITTCKKTMTGNEEKRIKLGCSIERSDLGAKQSAMELCAVEHRLWKEITLSFLN